MCFGSGSQAQLAAAEVASEQQRQAFEEALAFQKEQFQEAKTNREPFLRYNGAAMDQWAGLLGILPNLYFNQTPGGTLKNFATAAAASGATGSGTGPSGGTSGASGNLPGTAAFNGEKFPGTTAQPYKVGDVGKEQPLPGNRIPLPNPNVPDPNPTGPWVPPGTIPTWPPRY